MRPSDALLLGVLLAAAPACHRHDESGHGDHAHEGPGKEAEEAEPLAITRWTDRYELFVELPPPVAGSKVAYHAHVTRLEGFGAVTDGRFVVRFKRGGTASQEHSVTGVKRPGIFVFEGDAPPVGEYQVEMAYEQGGKTDVWDCGTMPVLAGAPEPEPEAGDGGLTFLKESQWKIPFATAWAEERLISERLEVAAVVEPAGSDRLTIGAPTSGRFIHDGKRGLAEGSRLAKGDVIGTISPTAAGEDWSRLVFAVDEARVAIDQNKREVARIKPLVDDGLMPQRRLVELDNELEVLESRRKLAAARAGATGALGRGGLQVRAEIGGLVTEVVAANGATVEAGAPLVRLGGGGKMWLRARFFPRPSMERAVPASFRLPSGATVDLEGTKSRFLSATPSVDPATRIATWLVELGDLGDRHVPELRSGTSVSLSVRFGEPKTRLAVPRGAVVEINTRPYVFVQRDGEHFDKRAVRVGPPDGAFIPVLEGVARGERVVTTGGFDIHLAAVMGTVESHRH